MAAALVSMAAKLYSPLSTPIALSHSSFSGSRICSPRSPPVFSRPPSQGLPIEAKKKIRGKVVCATNDKTVAVEVVRIYCHPKYKKRIKSTKKYQAHDPENNCKVGDVVILVKCAPVSKTKTFRVAETVGGRAPAAKLAEELLPPLESATATA